MIPRLFAYFYSKTIGGNFMEIIGIDVGYAYTKTSAGLSVPSKFTLAEPLLGSNRAITAWGKKPLS